MGMNHMSGLVMLGLAASISLCGVSIAASPVNTVNNGKVVTGGTYYNTAQGKTTFQNLGSGGLWVKSGTTVRGLEVDTSGNLTNNGGTLHFFAPNSVVRVDGNINVNAILNDKGAYLGNGGRVLVDSAYLLQNGNIFANGVNGGLVQMNVAGMTLGTNARIEAKGFGGLGGIVAVNSNGAIDLRRGSRIDTAGVVPSQMDRNVINIEGSIVNVEGVLRADGVQAAGVGSRGGTIRLVATGRTDLSDTQEALTDAGTGSNPTLTATEQAVLLNRNQFLAVNYDGDVHIPERSFNGAGQPNGGWVSANGSSGAAANNNDRTEDNTARAGDGGTIIIAAEHLAYQAGLASTNGGDGINGPTASGGGNGGLISVVSNGDIVIDHLLGSYPGVFQANGGRGGQVQLTSGSVPAGPGTRGGQGGLIAFSYNLQMGNLGGIVAKGGIGAHGAIVGGSSTAQGQAGNGGQGGLVVLSGNSNPGGGGQINVNGGRGGAGQMGDGAGGQAGVIVSPNPSSLPPIQNVSQYNGGTSGTLLGSPQPLTEQTAQDEILTHAETLLLLRRNSVLPDRPMTLFGSLLSSDSMVRSVNDPLGSGNALAVVLAKTPSAGYPYRNYIIGSSADNLPMLLDRPFPEEWDGLNNLATLTIVNDGHVAFPSPPDFWNFHAYGGSHVSILASGSVGNAENGYDLGGFLVGGTLNIASRQSIGLYDLITSSVRTGIGVVGLHAGSVTLKADENIDNLAYVGIFSGTPLVGMTHRYQAGNNFKNWRFIDSDAGFGSLPTPTNGGIITIKAANHFSNNNGEPEPREITANGRSIQGYGGLVKLEAKTFDIPAPEGIQANGTVQDGTVIIRTLP